METVLTPPSLGFVIGRHIANASHANLCFRAYSSIRRFYPDNLILIVDDGSSMPDPHRYDYRTIVVNSNARGSGEFGLYYYYYITRLFDRAVFLHDSMVIKKPLQLPPLPVTFLWHFNRHKALHVVKSEIETLLAALADRGDAERKYRSNTWLGMYGCCCVVTWDCLDKIVQKYKLFALLPSVNSRILRCAMERVLGFLFSEELDRTSPSLNGDIFHFPGAFERTHLLSKHNGYMDKTWHGR